MKTINYLGRTLYVLLITIAVCLLMYYLPDKVFGYTLRKVDLLADIRVKDNSAVMDSLRTRLALPDSSDVPAADSTALLPVEKDTVLLKSEADSIKAVRDSLYKVMQASWKDGDSIGTGIEDFSRDHTALYRFFTSLGKRETLDRPVRVAFLGDSFIEGDILVADFRAGMQKKFGGRGVGFVPIASNVAQYRPTVEHTFTGWKTHSMLTDKTLKYTFSGLLFESAKEEASVHYKTVSRYPNLQPVSRIRLIYERNDTTSMRLVCNATDTIEEVLPSTQTITQYIREGEFTEAGFSFRQAAGFTAMGVALEDNTGVIVDNFSLRGNSGMNLLQLDKERCEQLTKIRPYDLIVLQYGLNVVSDDVLQYGWYRQRMVEVVKHLKVCFPETDILLLSVSDRSHQEDGSYATMPAVLALLHAQRQIAKQTGIAFWNVFAAMGGENSMVRYVENNWASKDYTHLSFRGGKEIAASLLHAILLEKEFYDEADKTSR